MARSVRGWTGAGLVFAAALLVYIRTLAPTVYTLDSAELTNAAYVLGLAHPPGYPLYLLIGHLFTKLPFGDVGYRVNLMSAVFGALTVALVHQIVFSFTRRRFVALTSALLLAYSFYFWSLSLMAEVYTLHVFFAALLMRLAQLWQNDRRDRWLYGLAFAAGLSLTNHLSIALFAPGLLAWTLAVDARWWQRPRVIMPMIALFVLGLALYLYLPLRAAAQPPAVGAMQIDLRSGQDVLNTATARAWWPLIFAYSGNHLAREALEYLYQLWGNFLGIGLPLGMVGCAAAFRKGRGVGHALVLMFAANALFFVNYRAGDKILMYLPTYLVWAVWIGLAFDWLLAYVRGAVWAERFVHGVSMALVAAILLVNYPLADLSDDRRVYERADRIFTAVDADAFILAVNWTDVGPLRYLQLVEQRRLDVRILHNGTESYLDSVVRSELPRRPVYSTSDPKWLTERYDLFYDEPCTCYQVRFRYNTARLQETSNGNTVTPPK